MGAAETPRENEAASEQTGRERPLLREAKWAGSLWGPGSARGEGSHFTEEIPAGWRQVRNEN